MLLPAPGANELAGGPGLETAVSHAESVGVVFDPGRIYYGQLVQMFFSVALDPTQTDGHYPDQGSQYRSGGFSTTPEQARVARA